MPYFRRFFKKSCEIHSKYGKTGLFLDLEYFQKFMKALGKN